MMKQTLYVGTLEHNCFMLSGLNITDVLQRNELIDRVENDIFIFNRLASGKMKANYARDLFKMRRTMNAEDLRELLEQLKNYKP